MKTFIDFLPLGTFFLGYIGYGMQGAIILSIGGSILQLILSKFLLKKVETIAIITFLGLLIFGGATLLLNNPLYIKWKVSVINLLLALIFFLFPYFNANRQTLIEKMFAGKISLPPSSFFKLNLMWVLFFVFLGILNAILIYHLSEKAWVNFKVFGILGLTLVFTIIQAFYIAKQQLPPKT